MVRGRVLVGCAGYSYSHWRSGVFYPRGMASGDELKIYCETFPTCEINKSFYANVTSDQASQWVKRMPASGTAELAIKVGQHITHEMALIRSEELTGAFDRFMGSLWGMLSQKRLGPLLVQLPPSQHKDLVLIETLADLVRGSCAGRGVEFGDLRVAVEFRHGSWFCAEVEATFAKLNWAVVRHSYPQTGVKENSYVTGPYVYYRLHGHDAEHDWNYKPEELRIYVTEIERLVSDSRDVYVYFLNDAHGNGPRNAKLLMKMCEEVGLKDAVVRPIPTSKSLFSFFKKEPAGNAPANAVPKSHTEAMINAVPASTETNSTLEVASSCVTSPATGKRPAEVWRAPKASSPNKKARSVSNRKANDKSGDVRGPLDQFFRQNH